MRKCYAHPVLIAKGNDLLEPSDCPKKPSYSNRESSDGDSEIKTLGETLISLRTIDFRP